MQLRNKKTGEIIDVYKGEITLHYNQGRKTIHFKRLEDLEEWEDYEPKEFYFIDQFMSVSKGVVDDVEYAGRHNAVNYAKKTSNNLKTAGNYFETREEAEKAVEKLKAWKRLKDKGFRFVYHQTIGEYGSVSFRLAFPATKGVERDICLLFGGDND